MSLYPEGHAPFTPRGLVMDQPTADSIRETAHEPSLERCLNGASWSRSFCRFYVEKLRAEFFRAEQLIETQPLPAKDLFVLLPHDMAAMLETLKSTQKCLEEWLESKSCKTILAKYPNRPRTDGMKS